MLNIPKYMIVLKEIDREPISAFHLHKLLNISYTYIHKLKKIFYEKELITLNKTEVAHTMTITNKGKDIVEVLDELIEKLGIDYKDLIKCRTNKSDLKEEDVNLSSSEKQAINKKIKDLFGVPDTKMDEGPEPSTDEDLEEMEKELDVEEDWEIEDDEDIER